MNATRLSPPVPMMYADFQSEANDTRVRSTPPCVKVSRMMDEFLVTWRQSIVYRKYGSGTDLSAAIQFMNHEPCHHVE
jgi:hypothetical protein